MSSPQHSHEHLYPPPSPDDMGDYMKHHPGYIDGYNDPVEDVPQPFTLSMERTTTSTMKKGEGTCEGRDFNHDFNAGGDNDRSIDRSSSEKKKKKKKVRQRRRSMRIRYEAAI